MYICWCDAPACGTMMFAGVILIWIARRNLLHVDIFFICCAGRLNAAWYWSPFPKANTKTIQTIELGGANANSKFWA